MEPIIPFGLKNGKLIHISEVENGIKCNCICPDCGKPLIAKANKSEIKYKKIPHFSHSNDIECKNAYETTLHLLAKEVLIESKTLQLPDFHYDYNPKNIFSIFEILEIIEFDFLKDEVLIPTEKGDLIADILAEKNKNFLIIEFAKSHFVDHTKKEKIKNKKIATIEINLKDQTLDRDSMKSFFKTKSTNIYWVFNEKLDYKYQVYLEKKVQMNLEFEQREKENIEKQKRIYEEKVSENKRIIDITDEYVYNCPLFEKNKDDFKNSHLINIPILKKVFENQNWDKLIHGNIHSRFHIILEGNKIYLPNSDSYEEHKKFSIVYQGLRKIQEFEKISCFKHCRKCKHHEEEIKVGDKDYLICGYK